MSLSVTDRPKMQIREQDLFTYYLQKNFWAQGISYDRFVFTILEQEIEIIDSENYERRLEYANAERN